jgi:hypothetical protein
LFRRNSGDLILFESKTEHSACSILHPKDPPKNSTLAKLAGKVLLAAQAKPLRSLAFLAPPFGAMPKGGIEKCDVGKL